MEQIKTQKENPDVCMFYLEQIFDTAWELRDHRKWEEEAEQLLRDLQVETPDEAFNLLNKSLAITRGAGPLVAQHPKLKPLLVKLINSL